MFGISFSEIILILLITFLVFGPEQLPSIARKAGQIVATMQRFKHNLHEQFYQESGIGQISSLRDEMEQHISQIRQQLQPNLNSKKSNISHPSESDLLYQEYYFYQQPELDFERQPELFDE